MENCLHYLENNMANYEQDWHLIIKLLTQVLATWEVCQLHELIDKEQHFVMPARTN